MVIGCEGSFGRVRVEILLENSSAPHCMKRIFEHVLRRTQKDSWEETYLETVFPDRNRGAAVTQREVRMSKEWVPGLEGIVAAESNISYIDGQAGVLEYRGFNIKTLAEHCTFEEAAYLLLEGQLPKPSELADFSSRTRHNHPYPTRCWE